MDRMLSFVFLLTFCRVTTAIRTYYLDQHCGQTVRMGNDYEIRVKSTYRGNYTANMRCFFTVQGGYGSYLNMYFNGLNIEGDSNSNGEGTSDSCKYDFLEIYTGSHNSRDYSRIFCGTIKPSTTYYYEGKYYTLYFESDSTVQLSGIDVTFTQYHTGYCNPEYEYQCDNGDCIHYSVPCVHYSCGSHTCESMLPDNESVGGSGGLAAGGIIGIGIATVSVLVVVVIVVVVCRRHRALNSPVSIAPPVYTVSSATMNQTAASTSYNMAATVPVSYNMAAKAPPPYNMEAMLSTTAPPSYEEAMEQPQATTSTSLPEYTYRIRTIIPQP